MTQLQPASSLRAEGHLLQSSQQMGISHWVCRSDTATLFQAASQIQVCSFTSHSKAQAEGTVTTWGMFLSWQTAGVREGKPNPTDTCKSCGSLMAPQHPLEAATCLSPKTKSHRLYRERWKRHTQVTKAMGIKSLYRAGERVRNNNPILSLSQPSEFSDGKLDEIASFSPRNDKQVLILAKRISKLLSRKARHMGPTLPTHSLNHIQSILETPQSHHSF